MKSSLQNNKTNEGLIKHKIILICLCFIFFSLLTYGILYKIREDQSPNKSKASEVNYDFIIQLPNENDFPIYRLSNDNLTPECTGTNKSEEWVVNQWWNEYSLCLDANNAPTAYQECLGSSFAKENRTQYFCYWNNQKKLSLMINSYNMSDKGCLLSVKNQLNKTNPGGYSNYFLWQPNKGSNFDSNQYNLANLKKFVLDLTYSIDEYTTQSCPDDKTDPVYGKNSQAHIYVAIMILETDPATGAEKNVFVENVNLHHQGKIGQDDLFCNIEASSSDITNWTAGDPYIGDLNESYYITGSPSTIFDPIETNRFGQKQTVEVDLLQKLKNDIKGCLGDDVDFSNFKIGLIFPGLEAINTVKVKATFFNPQIKLELQEDNPSAQKPTTAISVSPTNLATTATSPSPHSTQLTISPSQYKIDCGLMDTNSDNKIDISDFSDFKKIYNKQCQPNATDLSLCGGKDIDNNGIININDFKNFIDKYKNGC